MLLFVVLCIVLCIGLCIVASSKNKNHLGPVLGRQYSPNPSIRLSKLRFFGRTDGRGPY